MCLLVCLDPQVVAVAEWNLRVRTLYRAPSRDFDPSGKGFCFHAQRFMVGMISAKILDAPVGRLAMCGRNEATSSGWSAMISNSNPAPQAESIRAKIRKILRDRTRHFVWPLLTTRGLLFCVFLVTGCAQAPNVIDSGHNPADPSAMESPDPAFHSSLSPGSLPSQGEPNDSPEAPSSGTMQDMPGMKMDNAGGKP